MTDKILEIYIQLTGKTIPDNLRPQYEAWALRAVMELENKLGWSLTEAPSAHILGVSPSGCECDVTPEKLLPAPEVRGSCRFFPFSDKQPFALVDPFKKVNAVYLCRVNPEGRNMHSAAGDVVVLANITDFAPRFFNPTTGKYIKACKQASICQSICEANCLNCSALLVDGDWVTLDDLIPSDLAYLLCGYIDWMATGGPQNRNLKSESVDGHSVGYADWRITEPYINPSDAAIIQLYAGPYGMIDRKNIW